jgi:predicted aspartyl protease
MPVVNVQYTGQIQAPDGSMTPAPPAAILALKGPTIQVTVSVHRSIAQQLLQQGAPLPQPIAGRALIDTGASATCIDEGIAKQLGLPVVDTVQVATPSHASVQQNVYPAFIEVVGSSLVIDAPRAIGAALAAQDLLLLIGRDLLQFCVLHYNGTTGQITLSL